MAIFSKLAKSKKKPHQSFPLYSIIVFCVGNPYIQTEHRHTHRLIKSMMCNTRTTNLLRKREVSRSHFLLDRYELADLTEDYT